MNHNIKLVGELPEDIRQIYYEVFNFAERNNLTVEQAVKELIVMFDSVRDKVIPDNSYTGVGSREVSDEEYDLMASISKWLANNGYILRSGKALGSDSAFEWGVHESDFKENKEIYVPWEGFKGNDIEGDVIVLGSPTTMNYGISLKLIKEIHPAADKLSQGAAKLHQRNCHQVLGKDLSNPSPSKFLLACAKEDRNGDVVGGTRTAWVLAKNNGVPCFNIRGKTKKQIFDFLKTVM